MTLHSIRNHRQTSWDLKNEWALLRNVTCSARTVGNRLLLAGLKSHKAWKKPFINERQRKAQLLFAGITRIGLLMIGLRFSSPTNQTVLHMGGTGQMQLSGKLFPALNDWILQQHSAPCHTARSVKAWMDNQNIGINHQIYIQLKTH
uniref:Transposase Tc1-like domain-containing protein n=1 Tax=Acanthochromis polyacanthus TaxID=80966 RepID=A0A3Q1EMJ1_9TELE